ncbi:MAG: hypothetical protein NVS1B14_02770 [Vulcanimicrobiaceae bacterium]
MHRLLFAFCLATLTTSVAVAAPVAPGRGQIQGDIIQMNQQFHIDHYNFRIQKIEWIGGEHPFAKARDESLDEGKGLILITATVKSTATDSESLPYPEIQVLYKDGTQSADDNRSPYSAAGTDLSGDYQPGQGATVRFYIPNMLKPSPENPITKLILQPHNGSDNDSGAPKMFRMLNPPVSVP